MGGSDAFEWQCQCSSTRSIEMAPKGRPRTKFTPSQGLDQELHRPHVSWDFTDPFLWQAATAEVCPVRLERWQRWCDDDGCRVMEIAAETSETGYRHGQGRVTFRRAYRLTQLKKLFPDVHWEPTMCRQDCLYLRKHDSVTVLRYDGRKQGCRNIFAAQQEAIQHGATIRECALMPGANYQSIRSAELLMSYIEPERPSQQRDVRLVPHASGTAIPSGCYRLRNAAFWDGYDAHKAIYVNQALLKLSNPQLAQILGPAPFRAGRSRQALYDTVYISGISRATLKSLGLEALLLTPWDVLLGR